MRKILFILLLILPVISNAQCKLATCEQVYDAVHCAQEDSTYRDNYNGWLMPLLQQSLAQCKATECPDGTQVPNGDLSQCENVKRCPDGTYVSSSSICVKPYQCPDGSYVSLLSQCPLKNCSDGSVIPYTELCPDNSPPPADNPPPPADNPPPPAYNPPTTLPPDSATNQPSGSGYITGTSGANTGVTITTTTTTTNSGATPSAGSTSTMPANTQAASPSTVPTNCVTDSTGKVVCSTSPSISDGATPSAGSASTMPANTQAASPSTVPTNCVTDSTGKLVCSTSPSVSSGASTSECAKANGICNAYGCIIADHISSLSCAVIPIVVDNNTPNYTPNPPPDNSALDKNTASIDKNTASTDKNTVSIDKNTASTDKNTVSIDKNTASTDNNTASTDKNTTALDGLKDAINGNGNGTGESLGIGTSTNMGSFPVAGGKFYTKSDNASVDDKHTSVFGVSAPKGNFYTSDGSKTVDGSLKNLNTSAGNLQDVFTQSPLFLFLRDFLKITPQSASCPVWTIPSVMGMSEFSVAPLCSDIMQTVWSVVRAVLKILAALLAFRIILSHFGK